MLCFGLVLTAHINTTTITITTNSYTISRLCAHRSVWHADCVSISVTYVLHTPTKLNFAYHGVWHMHTDYVFISTAHDSNTMHLVGREGERKFVW